jgi:hypothetical protein
MSFINVFVVLLCVLFSLGVVAILQEACRQSSRAMGVVVVVIKQLNNCKLWALK